MDLFEFWAGAYIVLIGLKEWPLDLQHLQPHLFWRDTH